MSVPFLAQRFVEAVRRAIGRLPACIFAEGTDRPEVHLVGPDADDFLGRISTAPLNGVPIGAGRRMLFLDGKGHVRGCATGWRRPSGWALDTDPGQGPPLLEHLEFFHIRERVQITLGPPQPRKLLVLGAGSWSILQKVVGDGGLLPVSEAVGALQTQGLWEQGISLAKSLGGLNRGSYSSELDVPADGQPVLWIRYLGNIPLPVLMLLVEDLETEPLAERLTRAGAVPAYPVTQEFLRILGGRWVFGLDVSPQRLGPEVTEDEATLSLTKGCYPGQEVVARIASRGHVNWRLRGVSFPLASPLKAGDEILLAGQKVGWLTSVTEVPGEEFRIGLAYMKKGLDGPQQIVESDGGPIMVHPLPFDLGGAG